ncbi:hypothetical protein BCR44DRAFT_1443534 [Catenaria anguillulae PL171]|uniref:Uncharacterized protein n=1 Tax=Catenaria anguillulae PL171 TaxID=765915 RepID=A0A1Y2H8P0_9FUNG|nr:hypothetical protein BCR44DRAFT_1443534 [Catenaria anguillulae PL171]
MWVRAAVGLGIGAAWAALVRHRHGVLEGGIAGEVVPAGKNVSVSFGWVVELGWWARWGGRREPGVEPVLPPFSVELAWWGL